MIFFINIILTGPTKERKIDLLIVYAIWTVKDHHCVELVKAVPFNYGYVSFLHWSESIAN